MGNVQCNKNILLILISQLMVKSVSLVKSDQLHMDAEISTTKKITIVLKKKMVSVSNIVREILPILAVMKMESRNSFI